MQRVVIYVDHDLRVKITQPWTASSLRGKAATLAAVFKVFDTL